MNKKCTLLAAAAFMVAGAFTANAQTVPPADWKAGNYYYLKVGSSSYLSLSGEKSDSVIVKAINPATDSKAAIDSALWQITNAGTTVGGTAYQFTNKASQAMLSFAAAPDAKPVLAPGVDKWLFTDGGAIQAYYGNNQYISLSVEPDLATADSLGLTSVVSDAADFDVALPPAAVTLTADQLGNGFSVFQLMFDANYGGNIFAGKEILAKDLSGADAGFVSLQLQSDQSFPDGKEKFFGVDTTKTSIAGATGVFGANFALDSTYVVNNWHTIANADFQKFKFTINLKNDSLAMYVKDAPIVNATALSALGANVRVVYASVAATKVLTVSNLSSGTEPAQGTAPFITVKKGTPVMIPTGTGVYYLKSAGLNSAGKYYVSASSAVPMMSADSLSEYHARGQWYVKENNGKYSIGSRYDGTDFGMNKEIFQVQGMANTYTVSGRTDSITFVYQADVDFADKFLGVRHFSSSEIADNGYQLSAVAGIGVGNLPVYAADTMLRAKAGSMDMPIAFKVAVVEDSIPNMGVNTGATSLGDMLYSATYKLAQQFTSDSVAYNEEANNTGLVLTPTADEAITFKFVTALEGGKYLLETEPSMYVSLDINNANLILSDKVAYFDFSAVDAPEYASFGSNHRHLGSNGKLLTMNPLNFFAEMKNEGQEILKADYNADNFSLWVEKADTVAPGKSFYYISSALHMGTTKADADGRYYLVSLRDSNQTFVNNNVTYYRAGFVMNDMLKTMADSPALFAFKTMEDGGYLLENQRELNRTLSGAGDFHTPYVGVVNNVVVMSNVGVPFTVENVPGPTSNEDITVSNVQAAGGYGVVTVYNATGRKVTLSNVLGQNVGTFVVTSDSFTIPAGKGVVIVAIEGADAQKVLVK